MAVGQRFWLGDIERGPEPVAVELGLQGFAVDDRAARDVDDVRIGFHRGQELGADQTAGRRVDRCGEDEVVGLRRQFLQ